jgi:hypothetical protein
MFTNRSETMTAVKTDFKKTLKTFYNPKSTPAIVTVPSLRFLMLDGRGMTESPEFQRAIEALFSISYKAKFTAKKELGCDYAVMPLEGLWWAENMADFTAGRKDRWQWTLMIMQPPKITPKIIEAAKAAALKAKENESIARLRLAEFEEGPAAQMLHIGPFSEEHENIIKLHRLIEEQGGRFDGHNQKHHEIYLSDFRKVAPAKMRTVLRQPFKSK